VLEVPDELGPFLVGGGAVFLAGPQGAAAGDERAVSGDELDVRWHAVHDRIGDEQPSKIVEGVAHRLAGEGAFFQPQRQGQIQLREGSSAIAWASDTGIGCPHGVRSG
jgi:hypothetical protein